MKKAAEAARYYAPFCPAVKSSFARNPMRKLVAGGGFEPPTFGL